MNEKEKKKAKQKTTERQILKTNLFLIYILQLQICNGLVTLLEKEIPNCCLENSHAVKQWD